jgi:hypothetical protein
MFLTLLICLLQLPGDSSAGIDDCYPITSADLRRSDAPRFEQFRLDERFTGKTATVNLSSHAMAPRYRTVLRKGSAAGPNFAGHYTIVAWGCGISCVTFAIVDARTGSVHFPKDFRAVLGNGLDTDDFEPTGTDYWGLRYRLDSRLLILLGALDEDRNREGATYYAFDGGTLRRIYSVYVKKRRCD